MVSTKAEINIIIAPIHSTYFSGRLWIGLNLDKIKSHLQSLGNNFKVKIVAFEELLYDKNKISFNAYLFYTSSYNASYQKYIADTIYSLQQSRPDIRLIPNYDLLLSFENKGFQELLKERKGIETVKGYYFGDISDFPESKFKNYPYVIKLLEGAMSSNVFLAKSFTDLNNIIKKKVQKNYRLELRRAIKKYLIKDKSVFKSYENATENYTKFFTQRTPFIIQEFIEGLDSDYKVLVFGRKFYTLKRYVRDNDFRASGSGKFVYEEPSSNILSFAKEVYEKLDTPFISLDIAEKNSVCYLIEYQGIGFGPVTLEKSKGYYTYTERAGEKMQWDFISEKPDLEKTYAESIVDFIARKEGIPFPL